MDLWRSPPLSMSVGDRNNLVPNQILVLFEGKPMEARSFVHNAVILLICHTCSAIVQAVHTQSSPLQSVVRVLHTLRTHRGINTRGSQRHGSLTFSKPKYLKAPY